MQPNPSDIERALSVACEVLNARCEATDRPQDYTSMAVANATLDELQRLGFATDRETVRAVLGLLVRDGIMYLSSEEQLVPGGRGVVRVASVDHTATPGSILETKDDLDLSDYRLGRLWNRSSGPVIPCEGCGTGVQRSKAGGRGRWCKKCAPIAQAMGPIRSAAKKCVEFGLTDAAAALEKSLADMRAAMRRNAT